MGRILTHVAVQERSTFVLALGLLAVATLLFAAGLALPRLGFRIPPDRAGEAKFLALLLLLGAIVGGIVSLTRGHWEGFSRTTADASPVVLAAGDNATVLYEGFARPELAIPVGEPIVLGFENQTSLPCTLVIPAWNVVLDVPPHEWKATTVRREKPEVTWFPIAGTGCDRSGRRLARSILSQLFEAWQDEPWEEAAAMRRGDLGERTWVLCQACHSSDDSETSAGPPLQGMYGSTVTFSDGTTTVVDLDVVRWWLAAPIDRPHDVRYPRTTISYQGQLDRRRVEALADYMRSHSSLTPKLPSHERSPE